MNKRERYFQKISEFKQRFRRLSSETIRYRIGTGSLVKEAEIAYREILEERGEPISMLENIKQDSKEK